MAKIVETWEEAQTQTSEPQLTGRQVNYYLVQVRFPNRGGPAYQAECEDITHALGLTPEEFCEFKGIWRSAAARKGNGKPGRSQLDQAIYDAEKGVHYAELRLKQAKQAKLDAEADLATVSTVHDQMFYPRHNPLAGQVLRAARTGDSQG